MEEHVGHWWHTRVTRWADDAVTHHAAAVTLDEVRPQLQLLHHACGGTPARRLVAASDQARGGKRHWLQRLAGTGKRAALPTLDDSTWALPEQLALFPDRALNRDLYLWLAAQAAVMHEVLHRIPDLPWLPANRLATQGVLTLWPGWAARHARLSRAMLAQRGTNTLTANALPPHTSAEACASWCLQDPWTDLPPEAKSLALSVQPRDVAPVWMWVGHETQSSNAAPSVRTAPDDEPDSQTSQPQTDNKRRRAERVTDTSTSHGMLLVFRAESLLSWNEFVHINRPDDDEELEDANQVADDMEQLSIAPGDKRKASRVRFDLDLPSAAHDDTVLTGGMLLPEWDYRQQTLLPDRCRIVEMSPAVSTTPTAADTEGGNTVTSLASPWQPDASLKVAAQRARRQLERLRHVPTRFFAQPDGDELDIDAWVRWRGECQSTGPSTTSPAANIYLRHQRYERSMCSMLLADLSLSTDAWAGPAGRVIERIRDALWVYGQAMHALGDRFAICGFSSIKRDPIRIHALKSFDEPWTPTVEQRIGAIKPGYYTRMGAAIRYATLQLEKQPEKRKLLLLLTDGKPNDLDHYEGRFGLEDTRHAIQAAKRTGLVPFAITIDEQATTYLPYLFGAQHFAMVHRPEQLAGKLTQVLGTLLEGVI